jgi:hypothetical protein
MTKLNNIEKTAENATMDELLAAAEQITAVMTRKQAAQKTRRLQKTSATARTNKLLRKINS